MADDKYETPQDKINAVRQAEAVSRRDESRANIMQGRALRMGDRYEGASDEADKAAAESAKRAQEAAERDAVIDRSGTAPAMSDSEGNFAPNPDVANTGGTGVAASNSTEGGDQAKSVDDVDLSPAEVGITDGNEVIGDPSEARVKQAETQLDEAKSAAQEAKDDDAPKRGRKSSK